MLPGVDAQQWHQAARDGVLVGPRDERERAGAGVLGEPGPARALDAGEGSVELLDQGSRRAKVLLDSGLEIVSQEASEQEKELINAGTR